MNETLGDAYFVEEVLRGNREAFRNLVHRYNNMAYGIAYNMTRNPEAAQDAVQEAFYRAFRKLENYNATYPFGVWLRRIVVNYILDQRKKKKVDSVSMTMEDETTIDVMDHGATPRDQKYEMDREEMVLSAIEQLPDKYRMILLLRHFEELSYDEIAETLSMPLGTVMTQLHRARQQLATLLSPKEAELLS